MNWKWFLIIPFVIFTSCKSGKTISRGESKNYANKKVQVILDTISEIYATPPNTLSFKASSNLKSNDKTVSFKATVRMVPDSVIWISISAYSLEVARILATPDTLRFIDKQNKKYYSGDFEFIANKFGVALNFYDLQSILLARSLGLGNIEKVKKSNTKEGFVLSSVRPGRLKKMEKGKGNLNDVSELVYSNLINPTTFKVERVTVLDLVTQNRASIQYATFENIDTYEVLSSLNIDIIASKNSSITSEFSKIVVNQPLKFQFKISSKYEPFE